MCLSVFVTFSVTFLPLGFHLFYFQLQINNNKKENNKNIDFRSLKINLSSSDRGRVLFPVPTDLACCGVRVGLTVKCGWLWGGQLQKTKMENHMWVLRSVKMWMRRKMGVPGSGQHGQRVYVLSCTLCVCVSRELLRVGGDQGAKRERGSRSGKDYYQAW